MAGQAENLEGLKPCAASQLLGGVLDDETVRLIRATEAALVRNETARQLILLAYDRSELSGGFLRSAGQLMREAATALDDWRDGGLATPAPTTI